MRELTAIACLTLLAGGLQFGLLPACVSCAWRPDMGALLGFCALAFLEEEAWLLLVFALGLQADVLGSPRLGLLCLDYLLVAGVLWTARADVRRAGLWGAWIAGSVGTALSHVCYLPLAALAGAGGASGAALSGLPHRLLLAAGLGLPVALFLALGSRGLGSSTESRKPCSSSGSRS